MKKILAFAAVAMLALGAQAWSSYVVEIDHVEEGGYVRGTIPVAMTLKLVDVKYNKEIYATQKIDFRTLLSQTDVEKYCKDYGEGIGWRFNVTQYAKDYHAETKPIEFAKVAGTEVSIEEGSTFGVRVKYTTGSAVKDLAEAFPDLVKDGQTAEQLAQAVYDHSHEGNLKTLFIGETQVKEPPSVDTLYNKTASQGADQFGSNIPLSEIDPVPEPTSGVLLVMGLAGLALKRKRAA